MKARILKQIIADIPDEVEIGISDMNDFSSDFEVSTYHEGDTYLDLIMPKHIASYYNDNDDELNVLL
jgi:hypothetical protein